jgi:hypothetical protein
MLSLLLSLNGITSAMLVRVWNHAFLAYSLSSYHRIKYFNNRLARYIFIQLSATFYILSRFASRHRPEPRLHK